MLINKSILQLLYTLYTILYKDGNSPTDFGLFSAIFRDASIFYSIFLCCMPPWGWLKEAETCRRTVTSLYIIVSDYATAIGIYMMTVQYTCARQSRLLVWWFSDTFLWSIHDLRSDRIRHGMLSSQNRNKSPL